MCNGARGPWTSEGRRGVCWISHDRPCTRCPKHDLPRNGGICVKKRRRPSEPPPRLASDLAAWVWSRIRHEVDIGPKRLDLVHDTGGIMIT